MPPPLADTLRWTSQGTATFLGAMATLPDARLELPVLPGWTGRHLLAHVALNAEALINLTTWARTGVETPMYSSPARRDADITAGARRPVPGLRAWVADAAVALDAAFHRLEPSAWQRPVRTAQGRTIPAAEIPWLRAREVMIHAVDLNAGVRFEDLPPAFLTALIDDITTKRSTAAPSAAAPSTTAPSAAAPSAPASAQAPADPASPARSWNAAGTDTPTEPPTARPNPTTLTRSCNAAGTGTPTQPAETPPNPTTLAGSWNATATDTATEPAATKPPVGGSWNPAGTGTPTEPPETRPIPRALNGSWSAAVTDTVTEAAVTDTATAPAATTPSVGGSWSAVRAEAALDGEEPALTLTATDHFGTWRVAGSGTPTPVTGTLAGIAAYLAGRDTGAVVGGPGLPRWL